MSQPIFEPIKFEVIDPETCQHEYLYKPNPNADNPHMVCRKCQHVKIVAEEQKT